MTREYLGHFILLGLLTSCSASQTGWAPVGPGSDASTSDAGAELDGGTCPAETDDPAGKITAAEYWGAAPEKVNTVTIWLREEKLPAVPDCPSDGAANARCAIRDGALAERQRIDAQALNCIVGNLGYRLRPEAIWYEEPFYLTSGQPVPVLVAFNLAIDWAQIERLAGHPWVARMDPPPGGAASAGVNPRIPLGCPTTVESAESKVVDLTSIVGKGQKPVVVELA